MHDFLLNIDRISLMVRAWDISHTMEQIIININKVFKSEIHTKSE